MTVPTINLPELRLLRRLLQQWTRQVGVSLEAQAVLDRITHQIEAVERDPKHSASLKLT